MPLLFHPGCQRLLFRAETDAAAEATSRSAAFGVDSSDPLLASSSARTGVAQLTFATSLQDAMSQAKSVNKGRHFFICDLPDEHAEVQLDVADAEQYLLSASVDTFFQSGDHSSPARRVSHRTQAVKVFTKVGPVGSFWRPRLLLIA
jgi:C4-dicarboxylate transporter